MVGAENKEAHATFLGSGGCREGWWMGQDPEVYSSHGPVLHATWTTRPHWPVKLRVGQWAVVCGLCGLEVSPASGHYAPLTARDTKERGRFFLVSSILALYKVPPLEKYKCLGCSYCSKLIKQVLMRMMGMMIITISISQVLFMPGLTCVNCSKSFIHPGVWASEWWEQIWMEDKNCARIPQPPKPSQATDFPRGNLSFLSVSTCPSSTPKFTKR